MIEELQARITYLEKHIEEQDTEIYQLSRRIDSLVKAFKEQRAQIHSLTESSGQPSAGSPGEEKPPHY